MPLELHLLTETHTDMKLYHFKSLDFTNEVLLLWLTDPYRAISFHILMSAQKHKAMVGTVAYYIIYGIIKYTTAALLVRLPTTTIDLRQCTSRCVLGQDPNLPPTALPIVYECDRSPIHECSVNPNVREWLNVTFL